MDGRWLGLGFGVVVAAATLLVPSWAYATPPGCGDLVVEDALAGATVGDQQGGTLTPGGFTPSGSDPSGSIVWSISPPLRAGCIELTVSGITTAGVGEHDLAELFTGPDGAFSDGATDFFLLLKVAGDVFPEVLGQLKVELGEELSALEVGAWSGTLDWNPADSHTLAVRLDGAGLVEFYRDDVSIGTVDYNEIAGGDLAFASLRVPNDGQYQVQPALVDAVYRDVRIYVVDQGPAGDDSGGSTGPGSADDTGASDPTITGADDDASGGGTAASVTSGDAGSTGTPDTGIPFPGAGGSGDDAGCSCRAASAPGTERGGGSRGWAWSLTLLLLRRRRVRSALAA